MKKINLLIFFFIAHSFLSQAQIAVQWQKTYGGSGDDHIADDSNYYDSPDHAVAKTSDGGFIITGSTTSSDGNFTLNHGGEDVALIKADSLGNVQWSASIGGSSIDVGTSVVQTHDGGYAVCGFSLSIDVDFVTGHGGFDIFIAKFNSQGVLQWNHSYGGIQDERAYSFYESADNNFVVAGFKYGANDYDYWVFKSDTLGSILWEKKFIGNSIDWVNAMAPTIDGGSIICGYSFSNDSDFTGSFGGSDYWVIKLDSVGNLVWKQNYGGPGNDWAFDITPTFDGGYAIAGLTEGDGGQVSGTHGGHDYWIIKIDANGVLLWQKAIGGSLIDECYEIIETSDHGLMVAGTSNSNDGDVPGNYGLLDYYLVKLDQNGNLLWNKTFGGSQSDWALSLIHDGHDNYFMFGNTKSNDVDVTGNNGGWDFWVLKLTSIFNTISGYYYYDVNANNSFDSSDVPLPNRMVKDIGNSIYGFTDSTGLYKLEFVGTGSFDIVPTFFPNFNINPGNYSITISSSPTNDTGNNFAASPIPGLNDIAASIIPLQRFRPGFPVSYLLTMTNVGTTFASGTLLFIPDPTLSFDSASVAPDTIIGDTLFWFNIVLNPLEFESVTVYCSVNPAASIGSSITSYVYVEDGTLDNNMKDNIASWTSMVTGSFDPNDKAVSIDKIYQNQLSDLPYLNYLIRFQNTGNDTAFTVRINDTISNFLDMDAFKIVSSSHPVTVEYQPLSRVITFMFSNILLVDSGTNQSLSNGYVDFRIQADSNLITGNQIDNIADIYFDFNLPIRTNLVTTTILSDVSVGQLKIGAIVIFPNPCKDQITFLNNNTIFSSNVQIQVTDVNGRVVLLKNDKASSKQFSLDVSNLNKGIYFIQLLDNRTILNGKFVKQ